MAIGLSTYAFHWRSSPEAPEPMGLHAMIDEAAMLDTEVFQICDFPAVESLTAEDLAGLRSFAAERGIELELGTRGISEAHLRKYLDLASALGSSFVRTMLHVPDHRPDRTEAIGLLSSIIPAFAERGVTLGLETYEQVATADLLAVVEAVNSPYLGICLDPANSVARLERPKEVIAMCAPRVVNVHVKDFSFTRGRGLIGFTLAGCRLGTGLLPFEAMIEAVEPEQRGASLIVEHWVAPADSLSETCDIEREWTSHSVAFLKANT